MKIVLIGMVLVAMVCLAGTCDKPKTNSHKQELMRAPARVLVADNLMQCH